MNMNVKLILYVVILPLSLFALDSLSIENKFKKNRIYQARLLVLFLAMSMSYLVVNFLTDVFLNSNFI